MTLACLSSSLHSDSVGKRATTSNVYRVLDCFGCCCGGCCCCCCCAGDGFKGGLARGLDWDEDDDGDVDDDEEDGGGKRGTALITQI